MVVVDLCICLSILTTQPEKRLIQAFVQTLLLVMKDVTGLEHNFSNMGNPSQRHARCWFLMLLFASLSFGIYVARCEALTGCQPSLEAQLEESGEGGGLYYITFNDIIRMFFFFFVEQYFFPEFSWKFVISMQ